MNSEWLKEKIDLLDKNKRVDDVSLVVKREDRNLTRFAENHVIQNVTKDTYDITISAFNKKSKGSATTQNITDEYLLSTLKRAEEIALNTSPDPEFVEPLSPSEIKDVDRYNEKTEKTTPADKANELNKIKKEAQKRDMTIAGQYLNGNFANGYANTRGHTAYHSYTRASFSITAMTEDSSGYGNFAHEDIDKIHPEKLAKTAFQKAELSKEPEELKPGKYPVILEPQAFGNLIPFFAWTMDRRASDEGYTYFSGKRDKRITSERINLYSNPLHPENPSQPFVTGNGLPLEKTYWIKEGILRNLRTSRYWARKKGIEPLGMPTNIIMDGGDKNLSNVIKNTDEALLITRLWYIRFVNQKELILTGMTRDGFFQIEDGEIVKAYKNMRFNQNPVDILDSVIELGKPERVEGSYLIPPVHSEEFKLSSGTLF